MGRLTKRNLAAVLRAARYTTQFQQDARAKPQREWVGLRRDKVACPMMKQAESNT